MLLVKTENLWVPQTQKMQKEGTIRKLYGVSIDKNSVHGSDSENAKIEINFFFDR